MPTAIGNQALLQRSVQQSTYSAPTGVFTNLVHVTDLLGARFSTDPQIFEYVQNKVIKKPKILAFLDEYSGRATITRKTASVMEYNVERNQIRIGTTGAPFTVPAYSAGTNTVVLPLDVATMQSGATYVMPQAGEFIHVPPFGEMLKITAVTASGSTPSITVRHYATNGAELTLEGGQDVLHSTIKELADCEVPYGAARFPGAPIQYDYNMYKYGDRQQYCGDAMDVSKPWFVPMEFGGVLYNVVHTVTQMDMIKKFAEGTNNAKLFHPNWGTIPTLKARGTMITHASETEVLESDLYYHSSKLSEAGVDCKTYTVICGLDKFAQYQRLINSLNQTNNLASIMYNPADSMKHLNLDWGKLTTGTLTLYITCDPSFSNGLGLGAANYKFKNAEFWIPMEDRPFQVMRNDAINWAEGENTERMITDVFFKSDADGTLFDMHTDSSGFMSSKSRFAAGSRDQEWSIDSRFFRIHHAPEAWGIGGLFN